MVKYKKINSRGTTLVDTIIGVFIFSIILTSGLQLIKYSSTLHLIQNEISIANTILNYVAEDLKAEVYSNISLVTDYSALYTTGASKPSELDKLQNGTININVSEVETGLKKVVITLQWNSSMGPNKNFSLTLFFCDKTIV